MTAKKAIFVDRDGTIIEDLHYPREAEKVTLIPGAVDGLKLMEEKGYLIFVVSNQSGVGRGIISSKQFREVHERTCDLLKDEGVNIEEFAYCFHHPEDKCECRKPEGGLVPQNHLGTPLDLKGSYIVGDRESDLGLAKKIGAKGFLVLTGKGQATKESLKGLHLEDYVCEDLLEVAKTLPAA